MHGIKMIHEIDQITRKSIACPAFPLCGLAMAEAERVQPEINARLVAKLNEMGMANTEFVTRTTGCPNGCARPYMAEIAFVGSGPNMYQLWLGGSPAQAERTAMETSIFKMPLDKLEETVEPIFAMYKTQRNEKDEGFGDFCHRVGIPAVEEYMKEYTLGSYVDMVDPFRENVEVGDAKIGVRDEVLALLQAQARRRGVTPETLLDLMVSEAFEGDEGEEGDGPGAVF